MHLCPVCAKSFPSPYKLRRHYVIHTGQKPFICTTCGKCFTQSDHLKTHLQNVHHPRLPTDCLQDAIAAHNQQANGNSPAARINIDSMCRNNVKTRLCTSAKTDAPASSSSNKRIRVERKVRPDFFQTSPFQRAPAGKRKHRCTICLKTFCSPSKLQRHSLIHTGQKPHSCTVCRKAFRQKVHLKSHLSSESLKPFQCMICNSSLRLDGDLICHHKINRNQDELGTLTTAQNRSNVEMPDSEAIRHSPQPDLADPLDLNVIVKPESWSVDCTDHKDSLPPDCEVIPSAQQPGKPRNDASERHKIHRCQMCLKRFPSTSKLQRHMLTHTGQRPFGCEVCGKRFRQKTHLRVHFRTHLWSRYHKQRSLYINRPPSRVGGLNRTAADVPVLEMLLHENLETHSGHDVVSLKPPTPSVGGFQRDNAKWHKLSPRVSKNSEVVRKVSTVRVERTPMAGPMPNPGNVQHKCLQCLKCFPSASKLERHEMVHTGLRPFHCVFCGKAFRQAAHLKTHQKTHCERKPSKPVNQQNHNRAAPLFSQYKSNAYNVKVTCPPKGIMAVSDGNKLLKDQCVTSSVENQMQPENSWCEPLNGFENDTRSASHESEDDLEQYLTNVHRKTKESVRENRCDICFKLFVSPSKLRRHFLIHTGLRPFRCDICGKTFTQSAHVRTHQLTH
uniref:C2H2-type domain-containing protein n=1 Tax=Gasterosteus aculeatus TaxID=69293 RepID=G3P8E8_GASAC